MARGGKRPRSSRTTSMAGAPPAKKMAARGQAQQSSSATGLLDVMLPGVYDQLATEDRHNFRRVSKGARQLINRLVRSLTVMVQGDMLMIHQPDIADCKRQLGMFNALETVQVTCSEAQHLQQLLMGCQPMRHTKKLSLVCGAMAFLSLTPELPLSQTFPQLMALNLDRVVCSAECIQSLQQLPQLHSLQMSSVMLGGEAATSAAHHISRLTQLAQLQMKLVVWTDEAGRFFSHLPLSYLAGLTGLRHLCLECAGDTWARTVGDVSSLTSLEKLELRNATQDNFVQQYAAEGLQQLSCLTRLKELVVPDMVISDATYPALAALSNITTLHACSVQLMQPLPASTLSWQHLQLMPNTTIVLHHLAKLLSKLGELKSFFYMPRFFVIYGLDVRDPEGEMARDLGILGSKLSKCSVPPSNGASGVSNWRQGLSMMMLPIPLAHWQGPRKPWLAPVSTLRREFVELHCMEIFAADMVSLAAMGILELRLFKCCLNNPSTFPAICQLPLAALELHNCNLVTAQIVPGVMTIKRKMVIKITADVQTVSVVHGVLQDSGVNTAYNQGADNIVINICMQQLAQAS